MKNSNSSYLTISIEDNMKAESLYRRSEILANRQEWIDFLKVRGRRKALGILDKGNGYRCCLGHGCYILKIDRRPHENGHYGGGTGFMYEDEVEFPPVSFVEQVGLWTNDGGNPKGKVYTSDAEANYCSLSELNDDADWSPLQIANFLQTVIEGGRDTPFKPLTEYPE